MLARDWATGFRLRWATRKDDAACETPVGGRRTEGVRYDGVGSMVTSSLGPWALKLVPVMTTIWA